MLCKIAIEKEKKKSTIMLGASSVNPNCKRNYISVYQTKSVIRLDNVVSTNLNGTVMLLSPVGIEPTISDNLIRIVAIIMTQFGKLQKCQERYGNVSIISERISRQINRSLLAFSPEKFLRISFLSSGIFDTTKGKQQANIYILKVGG